MQIAPIRFGLKWNGMAWHGMAWHGIWAAQTTTRNWEQNPQQPQNISMQSGYGSGGLSGVQRG